MLRTVTAPVVGARMAAGALVDAARDGRLGHGAQMAERALRHPRLPLVDPELFPLGTRAAQLFLQRAGYASWVVGAGLRDFLLLGKVLAPVEVLTDAPADVVHNAQKLAGDVRIRTAVGDYLSTYLARSDFTVCAVAVDLLTGEVRDPYDGVEAARQRLLVTVSDPYLHLRAQPAAAVRALRHQATYGMALAPVLQDAVAALAGQYGRSGTEEVHQRRLVTELFRAVRLEPETAARFLELLAAERVSERGVGTVLGVVVPELAQALDDLEAATLFPTGVPVSLPRNLRASLWARLTSSTPREGRFRRAAALLLPLAFAGGLSWRQVVLRALRNSVFVSTQQTDQAVRLLALARGEEDGHRRTFDELRALVAEHTAEVVHGALSLLDARDALVRASLGLPEHVGPSRVEVLEAAVGEDVLPRDDEAPDSVPPAPGNPDPEEPEDPEGVTAPFVRTDEVPTVPFVRAEPAWRLPVSLAELRTALRVDDLPEDSIVCRTLHVLVGDETLSGDRETVIEAARDLAEQQGLVPPANLGEAGEGTLAQLVADEQARGRVRRHVYWQVRSGEVAGDDASVEVAVLQAAAELAS